MHVIAIVKQYPRDFHVTTVPRAPRRARSRFALSEFSTKRAAASKKKEFAWKDDEAELLLAVTRDCKIKRLVEGTCDYRQT